MASAGDDDKNDDGYNNFEETHGVQLLLSGVPERYWRTLYGKLKNEVFDAGKYFSMICEDDEDNSSIEDSSLPDDDDSNAVKIDDITNKAAETGGTSTESKRGDNGSWISEPPKKRGSFPEATMMTTNVEYADIRSPGSATKGSLNVRKHTTGDKWKVMVSSDDGVKQEDPNCVFLVDHAWTYMAGDARNQLTHAPALLYRMFTLMDLDAGGLSQDEQIQLVLGRMWRYNQTYSIQHPDLSVEEKMPVWYVMDEFGSRITHGDEANVRLVPFFYIPEGVSYSIMFPLRDIEAGDLVTRDYVEGALYHRPDWRSFYLLPWIRSNFAHLPFDFGLVEEKFFTQDRHDEALPESPSVIRELKKKDKSKVYTEYEKVRDHLKHPKFEITDSREEADVLWLHKHFKDYKSLFENHPHTMVNQIPYESVLTVKDLLAAAVHSWYEKRVSTGVEKRPIIDPQTLESRPSWLATTYNLRTELPQFVSYFQNREKKGLDNHWIIKPWNLARGLDTTVTSDLSHIIRLIGSGPKIACKYLEDPVLFYRDDINDWVKFDLRFIVLLRSVKPLEVYVYDRFWLRFALKPFTMDMLDDYEKHFTVFNYLDSSKIKQVFSKDFVDQFQRQYPQSNWADVQKRIYASFKELFEIACGEEPPRGLGAYPQCRAMYGLDVMLKWSVDEKGEKIMKPVILEVNFMPDCARACDYYPDFMNTVFETLFADEVGKNLPVTLL